MFRVKEIAAPAAKIVSIKPDCVIKRTDTVNLVVRKDCGAIHVNHRVGLVALAKHVTGRLDIASVTVRTHISDTRVMTNVMKIVVLQREESVMKLTDIV